MLFAGKDARTASEAAGYDPAGTSFHSGALKRANRRDVKERVRELQARAAERAEIDQTFILLAAKNLLEFNVADYLTNVEGKDDERVLDVARATREQLGRLQELTQDVVKVGRGAASRLALRTKIKGHDKVATLGLMARILGFEKDPTADALTGIGDKLHAALERAQAAK